MNTITLSNFLTILIFSGAVVAQDFSYDGIHGPQYWGKDYQSCVGKHQSPINIEEHYVRTVTLPPLLFSGFDVPRIATLTNNGHTVLLRAVGHVDAFLTGGPLGDDVYTFEQLHFHWGENDWEGSEDMINNQSFAMELHAVFYKSIYRSAAEAQRYPDGLTVLAYFMAAGEEMDPSYEPLVETLPQIEVIGKENIILEDLILESILMTNRPSSQNYFTYNGSLTTPPCSEVVTWIDFKQPHILSREQIAAFRRIRSAEGERVTHNFRPVQPLEDRIVYENIPELSYHNQRYYPEQIYSGQLASRASVPPLIVSLIISTYLWCR
ncbi:carbonic anhydrase 2-like [Athalia rosae]|uniref:carbonic anhydrase 2-like n=1 Tax=Athalia rosae TaxID=37344 RepID=UPI00203460F7|nr:carbonic anhydrase 2-like [Athalia rosae]